MPIKGVLTAIARRLGSGRKSGRGRPLRPRLGLALLLLGLSGTAQAGIFCSDAPFNGIIDGNDLYTDPADSQVLTASAYFDKYNVTQVTIDTDCTFRDWPISDPLNVTINFQTNDPSIYLIVFDNVWFDGNMACSNIDHKLWVVNSDPNAFKSSCQDLFIPAETIKKLSPAQVSGDARDASVGIGEEFTYTLTVPSMAFPDGAPSPNQLRNIYISDDLNATGNGIDTATLGADLTLVSYSITPVGTSPAVALQEISGALGDVILASGNTVRDEFCNGADHNNKNICLKFPGNIEVGHQYTIEITVKVDNSAQNQGSPTFINTARWWFGRDIDIDGDGNITPEEQFTPLPGENGVSGEMYIGAPNLEISKTAIDTAMNLAGTNQFTLDLRNGGSTDAWNITIVDRLPDSTLPAAGTCPATAPPVSAQLYGPGGAVSGAPLGAPLVLNTDFTVGYTGEPTCELVITTISAAAVVRANDHLVIRYDIGLDPDTTEDGFSLTNYAGATEWYSAADSGVPADRIQYTRTLTDGTPATVDHEDAFTVTTALTGFYFQKTARNLTTGEYPATTAAPGDTIRYELRVFNVTESVTDVSITDALDTSKFDMTSLSLGPPPAGAAFYNDVGDVITFVGNPDPYDVGALSEVNVYFDITLDAGLTNGTTVSNFAIMDSTSFTNIQSDDPFTPNAIGNAADPGYDPDTTDFVIQTPGPLSKGNNPTSARIGEQFTYRISIPATPVDVPLYDVRITDDLSASGADLSFVSATVFAGGSWSLSNTGTATSIILEDLSTGIDIPANGQAVIDITVELSNSLANQAGNIFTNSATFTYNRSNGVVGTVTNGTAGSDAGMTVLEPAITTVTKIASNTAPVPGETITYTVELTAASGADISDVFDVTLVDTLPSGLTYAGTPTVTTGPGGTVSADNYIGEPDIFIDGGTNEETLTWSFGSFDPTDIDIAEGETITVTYQVSVDSDVLSGQDLVNSIVARWTSLDTPDTAERDGSDGAGLLNDYVTTAVTETVTTPLINTTITKERTDDSWGSGDINVRVGDVVEYTLTIPVPEGTLGNMQIVDTLPQGLDFRETVSINGNVGPAPYTAAAPFLHADIVAPVEVNDPATGPTTVTWTIGDLNNPPADGVADNFIVVYRAVVLNNDALAATPVSQDLYNSVDLSYDTAGGPYSTSDADTLITVQQPNLSVTKTASPAGGDLAVIAGEVVTYTVDIINAGTAPAYDTVLQDTIPVGMRTGGVTTTSITRINTATSALVATLGNLAPAYDAGTGLAVWDFNTGVAEEYTFLPGETLRVEYQVSVDAAIGQGLTLANSAQVAVYYSFDDNNEPFLGPIIGAREDYPATNIAAAPVYTAAGPTKTLTSPATPEAVIGQVLTYQIAVPGTVIGSPLYDLNVIDNLDANLELVSVNISGGGVGVTDSSTSSQLNISIDEIPAGQQAIIDLQVRVLNSATANGGTIFGNTASYTYAFTDGSAAQAALVASAVDVTIAEPLLGLTKASVNLTSPGQPPDAGDILEYTLTLPASGAGIGDNFSDAFDVSISDSLSLGLSFVANSASVDGAGNTISNPSISGDGDAVAQTLTWSLADATADIDVTEGSTVIITYQVLVRDSVIPGQVLTNSAVAEWTSLDGVVAGERTGSGTPVENDYFTAPQVTSNTVIDNTAISKSVINESWGAVDGNVRVGDVIEYELRITLNEGSNQDIIISDSLPVGLRFEGTASINVDAAAPFDAVAPFSHGSIAGAVATGDGISSSTSLTWNIGDIINAADNNAANDEFVIVYRARVLNDVIAQAASTTLSNNASLFYTDAGGPVLPSPTATVDVAVQQPILGIGKNATPAGGDNVIDAAEVVTYTLQIANSGDAPAYDLVIQDTLPDGMRDNGVLAGSVSISLLSGPVLPSLDPTGYDPLTGIATWNLDAGGVDTYTIPAGDTLVISYNVQADADLGPGLTLINSAEGVEYFSFDNEAPASLGGINGTRQRYGAFGPATATLTTGTPGALLKENPLATTAVTIGEEFTYTITVPETPVNVALYDVRVLDDLTALGADVTLVSIVDPSGTWNPINVSGSNNLVILDALSGIDIPAGGQATIEVTLRINNVSGNTSGDTLVNTASYTYNQVNGNSGTQTAGGGFTTAAITVAEPALSLAKTAAPLSPINGGTVMTFTLTMNNTGTSTAFDVDVTDTLPPELSFDASFTPTATIDAVAVPGFVATPAGAPAGPLVWGNGNGDGSLDVPAGSTLIITYQAIVNGTAQAGATFSNTVYSHWSSLNGANAFERDGAGCPTVSAPDTYCAGPAQVTLTVNDTNTIAKSIVADTYATTTDGVVRIGDTITYRLELILQEGLTNSIVVTDALPAGLAFVDIVSINGDTVADYTPPAGGAGSNFGYNPISAASLPTAGDTGSLSFNIGNVSNDPLGDASTDTLVIEYRAEVITNTLVQQPSTTLTNTATLVYDDATGTPITPDPVQHQASASATVLQPVMTTISKIDPARTSPYTANVATDVMNFQIESCNATGLAPAYGVVISDTLATQLDETSITNLVVWINGAVAPAVDYVYTPPAARGGSFTVELLQPVQPGQCARVDYDIGFYTDFGPNQTWNNSTQVDEYWSLGAGSGQQYAPVGPAQFEMNNNTTIDPPLKTTTAPVSGEATIGEAVTYQIAVPATAANAALFDVTVTDTLDASLAVVSVADVSGNGLVITDNSVGNNLNLVISQIPAGQQAIIEIQTLVANNAAANGGSSFSNTASYTYAVTSGGAANAGGSSTTATAVSIVEPLLTLSKAVANVTNPGQPPGAGDVLQYTLTLPASGAGAGDAFSDAFDVGIIDDLSLGLAYQPGSATTSAGTITDPAISGDGNTLAQTLTWSLADGSADIDVTEGSTLIITYDVLVLDNVLAGQTVSNQAVATWTGLDGVNALERDGSGTPAVNDYITAPAVTSQVVLDNTAFAKARTDDTWNGLDDNVRIGDIIEYELRLTLNEGANQNVVVSDTLPLGLRFEGVASINNDAAAPYDPVPPFDHAAIGAPTVTGDGLSSPTSLTWNIGNITNAADNNAANDDFVIVYYARVLDGFFAQNATTTLTNNASMFYTNSTGAVTLTSSYVVTLDQPILAVSKLAAPAGGDTVIDAGEVVTYTVDVVNSGNAPAYDVTVTDTLPAGMRNSGGPAVTSISLLAGGPLAVVAPTYDPLSGVATWNFDNASHAIPAGDTLRIVYTVTADADLGAGLTLTNTVEAPVYYSFDDAGTPLLGGVSGVAEVYGPSNQAQQTLTTAAAVALDKQNTATEAVVGIPFSYRIIVPATPQTTALNDVRILDDLTASTADLSFVSVQKISAGGIWVPVNTGTATNIVIEDTANGGIDIPANTQIEIEITVVLNDSVTNVSGLVFTNTADYTYNAINDDPLTVQNGLPDTTGAMTIIGADTLTLDKTGPATMRTTTPGDFVLNIQNTGTATAWDVTVTDLVPHPDPGGMCDAAPFNISVQLFDALGTTPIGPVLVENTDYTVSFVPGTPNCTLTFTMTSAAAAIPAGERLIINYSLNLDIDTPHSTLLTNVAGTTEWFSDDTAGAGATGQIRTYTRTLTDGTTGTVDHEDAVTVFSESPVILFSKVVENVTTGENPGTVASPGDRLRYTITASNQSTAVVTDFNITDELDALNGSAAFAPSSLVVTNAGGGNDFSDANGGSNGTGLLDIQNLTLGAQGSATETVTVVFEVDLAPVITSGTTVLNQAQLTIGTFTPAPSNDPNTNPADVADVIGDEVPTPILINSAPAFEIFKTSADITTGTTGLIAGDTLRYTITVRNTGSEDAINAMLQDSIPVNTTYVAGSTTLNGAPVTDPAAGVSALEAGMSINSNDTATVGRVTADPTGSIGAVATITFDVTINNNVLNGAVISNQASLASDGVGSGTAPAQVSDDPATATLDDPTLDIVGNLPLVDSTKTVALVGDAGTLGFVDPGDTLRYTITTTNFGAIPATGVVLTDAIPADTTYVPGSAVMNGLSNGTSFDGTSVIADYSSTYGDLAAGATVTVTFEVTVNGGTATGTVISNQGFVATNELPTEPTDADGDDTNGDQPTLIAVGDAQQLAISKQVLVVGGGAAIAGGQLEYVIQITNVGLAPASNVLITDDLSVPIGGQKTYVPGSATLNGLAAGTSFAGTTVTADYGGTYGDLAPGASATLRFRVQLDAALAIGTTVTNTADTSWNAGTQNASASVSIDIGGIPGAASLNGSIWHDANFDNAFGAGETPMGGWTVQVLRNGSLVGSFLTDAAGNYRITGLSPNDVSGDTYEVRFLAPGAGASTASLGLADSAFTDGLQRVTAIILGSGSNVQNVNLPIDPNGVVYNSIVRTPVAGATLVMVSSATGTALPATCFEDPAQQGQVTLANGYYKFDINFLQPECPSGGDYQILVTVPANDYTAGVSAIIPPLTDATTAAYSVPACTADAIGATTHCEVQTFATAPAVAIQPRTAGTDYHLHISLSNGTMPQDSQLFNNHIPLDPELDEVFTVSKTSAKLNVVRGDIVPYTITISNTLPVPMIDLNIIDTFPAGFKYVEGSARLNDVPTEPTVNGNVLTWPVASIDVNQRYTVDLLFIVGSGVQDGEYVNRANVFSNLSGTTASGDAQATVRVVPDPTFDCTDVIGKVFDDRNLNGFQDAREPGIPGVRMATARGLLVTTDEHGRFHVTCAATPDERRGSNFILKLDEHSLPTGFRVTSENPRVEHATRGKMLNFNFGATIHHVVNIDVADGAFEKGGTALRPQWVPRLSLLIDQLRKGPSVLRLTYLADVEDDDLVEDRIDDLRNLIMDHWQSIDSYKLTIESEIFWRHGGPVDGGGRR